MGVKVKRLSKSEGGGRIGLFHIQGVLPTAGTMT
jgi:hypothetical protein